MTEELSPTQVEPNKTKVVVQGGSSDAVYGIGMIGAWVYYFGLAKTNEERFKAFLKGLVWPAFLVYDLYKFLNKEKAGM